MLHTIDSEPKELEYNTKREFCKYRSGSKVVHGNYTLAIRFRTPHWSAAAQQIIQDLVDREVLDLIQEKSLVSLAGSYHALPISHWIASRLRRVFPTRNIEVVSIAVNQEGGDQFHLEEDGEARKEIEMRHYRNRVNRLRDRAISCKTAAQFARRLVKCVGLRSCDAQANFFTSKSNLSHLERLVLSQETLQLVTFVCPPYVRSAGEYVGLFDDVSSDPATYNFDYNYPLAFTVLQRLVEQLALLGVVAKGVVVLCDRGLIGVDRLSENMGGSEIIEDSLGRFFETMRLLSLQYREIEAKSVSQFRHMAIPLGLPLDTPQRQEWLTSHCLSLRNSLEGNRQVLRKYLQLFLQIGSDPIAVGHLFYGKIDTFDLGTLDRSELLSFSKTFSNVHQFRVNRSKVGSVGLQDSFVDALVRYVTYKEFGICCSDNLKRSVCVYTDPGLPAAGHHFMNDSFPVLMIDAGLITSEVLREHIVDG